MDEAETLEHHLGETITEPEKLKAHLDSKLSRKRERNDELKLQLKELRQQEFKINQSVNLLNSDLKKQTEEGEHLMNKYVDMNVKMAYLTAELEYRRSSLTEVSESRSSKADHHMTSIDTEKKILEGSIQTLNELKRKMRRLHRDLDKDIENIRMGVFGSIQLMKRSMNDISRKVGKHVHGNFQFEERDAKSALVHAEAVVAAVKPGIQESITYDLLFGIHKLREIQEEREDRKRHILQSQSADFTAGSLSTIFADPAQADYETMDRVLDAGLKQLKDRDQHVRKEPDPAELGDDLYRSRKSRDRDIMSRGRTPGGGLGDGGFQPTEPSTPRSTVRTNRSTQIGLQVLRQRQQTIVETDREKLIDNSTRRATHRGVQFSTSDVGFRQPSGKDATVLPVRNAPRGEEDRSVTSLATKARQTILALQGMHAFQAGPAVAASSALTGGAISTADNDDARKFESSVDATIGDTSSVNLQSMVDTLQTDIDGSSVVSSKKPKTRGPESLRLLSQAFGRVVEIVTELRNEFATFEGHHRDGKGSTTRPHKIKDAEREKFISRIVPLVFKIGELSGEIARLRHLRKGLREHCMKSASLLMLLRLDLANYEEFPMDLPSGPTLNKAPPSANSNTRGKIERGRTSFLNNSHANALFQGWRMQQELNDASIDDDDGEERANNELCSYKAVSEALVQLTMESVCLEQRTEGIFESLRRRIVSSGAEDDRNPVANPFVGEGGGDDGDGVESGKANLNIKFDAETTVARPPPGSQNSVGSHMERMYCALMELKNMGNYSSLFLQGAPGDEVLDEAMITLPLPDQLRSDDNPGVPQQSDPYYGETPADNNDETNNICISGWNNVLVAVTKLYIEHVNRKLAGLTVKPRVPPRLSQLGDHENS